MTGSVYFYSGTISEVVYPKEISKDFVKVHYTVIHHRISPKHHDERAANTKINDFKTQETRFIIHGDIIASGGLTPWEHQNNLGSLFEAGGTFEGNIGSFGAFTGFTTKYKFTERAAIDKFEATIEFLCGSSRS